jgi:hypothetical protein
MSAASESWCVGGDVIVGTIWVSAASLFPSLLPGVLWPVACVRFALCPLEHTTIPTDSYGPLHALVLASTNTTSTTVLVLLAGTTS